MSQPAEASRRGTRALWKCDGCRQRKVKCEPEGRIWNEATKQKCKGCQSRNEPCGPSTKIPRGKAAQDAAGTGLAVAADIDDPFQVVPSGIDADQFLPPDVDQEGYHNEEVPFHQWGNFPNSYPPPSQSPYLYVPQGPPTQPDRDIYHLMKEELCWMGKLAVLHEYCQHRANMVADLKRVLPLENFDSFIAALDVVIAVIADRVLTSFRRLKQLRLEATAMERELVGRRAYAIGRRFQRCEQMNKIDAGDTSSFHEELESLREDLISYYRDQKDYSEASRLHRSSQGTHVSSFGSDIEMLSSLAGEMNETLQAISKDLQPTYRRALNPAGNLKISAAHLALIGGVSDRNPDPATCRSPNSVGITGRNELHLATEVGNAVHVRWLCESAQDTEFIDLEQRDSLGFSALMIAASVGNVEIFRYLLECGAKLKSRSPSTRSLLSLASMAGHIGIVEEMLRNGVIVREHDEFCSPIHDAAASGRSVPVIELLLKRGAEPRDERPEHGGRCASAVAKSRGHTEISDLLVKAEQQLEKKLPTKDVGKGIKKLKRMIDQDVRPKSPGSDSSRIYYPGHDASSSIITGRTNKRQRSSNQDSPGPYATRSSAASTPQVLDTTPAVPSPLSHPYMAPFDTVRPRILYEEPSTYSQRSNSSDELDISMFLQNAHRPDR